jgi:hypothetical protein
MIFAWPVLYTKSVRATRSWSRTRTTLTQTELSAESHDGHLRPPTVHRQDGDEEGT